MRNRILQKVELLVRMNFEAHKRYGDSTIETKMRFNDILLALDELDRSLKY